ncbi:MAG: 4Fe-4S dicluster domain-containing protein [Candidatus Ranarchaeia archaeon]
MNKQLVIYPDRCVGCESCTIACSFYHHKEFNRVKSRININIFWKEGKFVPTTCNQCEKAPCITVCPVNALKRNDKGVVILNQDLCIGCKMCVAACPFGAMNLVPNSSFPIKCDLCDGDPACVKICGVNAIEFKEPSEFGKEKREKISIIIKNPSKIAKKKRRDYGKRTPWSIPGFEEFEPIP